MNTEYKGFNISETNGRFVVTPGSVANGFKAEGYATLSGAKGAITKFANMHGATEGKANDDGSVSLFVTDKDGTEGTLTVGIPCTPPMFDASANCDAIAIRAENAKTKSDAESDKVMAQLRYHGFVKGVHGFTPKQPDSRSRNKREGRYAGTANGEHGRMRGSMAPDLLGNFHVAPKTRKQRKAAKMASKA